MNMNVKAGLYIRTSRDEENKTNRNSIQTQINGLKKYCDDNNYAVIKIYVDQNESGSTFDRPKFNEMMIDAKEKNINTIIVKDLSRLGRSLYQMGDYLERIFPSMGIRFIAVNDDVDSIKGISDDVIYKNFFNDLYIKDIRRKMLYSLGNKAKNKPLSCRNGACFGYELDEQGNWIINTEEANIVRRIFEDYLNGKSCRKIAKSLENDKIMTSSYRKFFKYGDMCNIKHKGIKPNPEYYYKWDTSTICYILANRQYTGCIVNNLKGVETVLENHHEPTIDDETFRKIQTLSNGKVYFNNQNNELKNFVKCGCCGYAMIKTSYGTHQDVYQCIRCKKWIDTDVIEATIKTEVEKKLAEAKPVLTGNKLAKEKQRLKARIESIEGQITELILSEASDSEISILNDEIKHIQEQMNNISINKNILYDVNGNELTEEQLKNWKLVAKTLFKKATFKKIDDKIDVLFVNV